MTLSTELNQFQDAVGVHNVLTDDENRSFYSTDMYRSGETPLAVIRPPSVDALQSVIAIAGRAGIAMFVRGGGVSYTDAYTPSTKNSIVIDSGALDQIVEINEEDMYVTVEAGVTWEKLNTALAEKGLRTPFWGPFSGIAATVGGSISQNAVSHGTGRYGVSAQSVVSMDVVLADGEMVSTGSAGRDGENSPFFRFAGPDVTALFTGDAGALGVKARITLRLIRRRSAVSVASFGFETFDAMSTAMAEVAREGLADENFALDPVLQEGQIARQKSGVALKTMRSIFDSARNPIDGALKLAKMGMAGTAFLEKGAYSTHYFVDGVDKLEVRARLSKLREICMQYGVVTPDTVPTVVKSMPFAPLFNMIGPYGERWVPIHGVMPFSKAKDFHAAWNKMRAEAASDIARHGVKLGGMFLTIANDAFLYEIAFYWPDETSIFHEKMLPEGHLDTVKRYEQNIGARDFVDALRARAIDLYQDFGAVHFQIGKSYPFLENRSAPAANLLTQIKSALDPHGLMNPGALGLQSTQHASAVSAAQNGALN